MVQFVFWCGIIALAASNVGTYTPREEGEVNYRLPNALKPVNYELRLHPDLEQQSFVGQETISINVIKDTNEIVMHSVGFDIKSCVVNAQDGAELLVSSVTFDLEIEVMRINMMHSLPLNSTIEVRLLYKGRMKKANIGMYKSSYLTPDNEKRNLSTTKFEPTHARKVFPCFDEPAMKATFEIVLVRPKDGEYHALSNMDIKFEKPVGDFVEVHFNKSVPMSSYLACFIVSDFVYSSGTVQAAGIGHNFDIRVFAAPHQLNKTLFALDTAIVAMQFFIQYYQVEYPLPKLDLIAIPDFSAGAMENWGLATFRESTLLYANNFSSTVNKQKIAGVVVHELAHMWFGNLVTMAWWNDLWLNEGFATYMQYKCLSKIYADWGMLDQFVINEVHLVMKLDSYTSSHPILHAVESPEQIELLFDKIIYKKGAAIIRMFEDVVGVEKFALGITNYLNKFKYRNTETSDFIAEFEELKVDFNVRQFMRTFTEQKGLPLINVERTSPSAFSVTQNRFFANIEDYNVVHNDSEFHYTWTLPLTYFSNNDSTVVRGWFDNNINVYAISVPTDIKWLKFNVHQTGYYRVNYDPKTWNAILQDLKEKPEIFAIADRAHLINDIFALADASQLGYDFALNVTKYLSKEMDYVPWYAAINKLKALKSSLMYQESYADFLKFTRLLLKDAYDTIDWDADIDDHLKKQLRTTILEASCSFGIPQCLEEATRRFESWIQEPNNTVLDADLRKIVYYYGMQEVGDDETWGAVWNIFLKEHDTIEKKKLMFALAGVKVPWLLHRFIELAGNESFVRKQDYSMCIEYIALNPIGELIVWDYLRENWRQLTQRFGIGRLIKTTTKNFHTKTKLKEMEEFFQNYVQASGLDMVCKQATETVKHNVQWLSNNERLIAQWLKASNEMVS